MRSIGRLHSKSRHASRVKNQTEQQSSQSIGLDLILYQKFKAFMTNQRLSQLKRRLNEFYGKNFTINYKASYGFQEEWHNKQQNIYQKSQFQVINQSYFGIVLSLTIMLINTIFIWFRNLQEFFGSQNDPLPNTVALYIVAFIIQMLDSGIKLWFFYEHNKQKQKNGYSILEYLKILYANLLCIPYLIILLLKIRYDENELWFGYQLLCQYLLYTRSKKIFQSYQYMSFALRSQYQYKIFDLITNLIIFTHFVVNYGINLVVDTVLGHFHQSLSKLVQSFAFSIKYVYSFYFCSTTILTVGYGDITPKNYYQTILVIAIQIFGIVFFGYMINEIGYNLSALRQKKQVVKKQLGLIDKMGKYYKMDEDLVHRARSYLINHHLESAPLSPQQEKGLMLKFNQQLRNQIQSHNTLSIVKSSIFFLCRWSKSMQNSVANHLIHYLFSPGQQIYQPEGKQRIYLFRLGKVDIYTERRGNRLGNKSILKSISIDLQRQVSNNCYGYTSVISTRPVRLYAISKDYTSAYYVDKQRFLECVNSKNIDFEYYHQIKNKIDQSHLWESLEVPSISNSKHHYSPTHLWIIRNSKKRSQRTNQRRLYVRQERLLFRGSNIFHDPQQLKQIHRVFIPSLQDLYMGESTIKKSRRQVEQYNKTSSNAINTFDEICGELQMREFKKYFHHYFQQGKQYNNYFIDQNPQKIVAKVQRQSFLNKMIEFQNSCEKWINNSSNKSTFPKNAF